MAAPESPVAIDLVQAGFEPVLAALLARRGVLTVDEARRFVDPSSEDLHDPLLLAGMPAALDRLERAADRGETVVVVGDYDADGVTALALLVAVLRACGLAVRSLLPQRLREGYGFQTPHVETAHGWGAGLIITVDCGTSSFEAAAAARQLGIDVIVTDHHLPGAELPAGVFLVNPRQPGCGYPFRDLAGVGLAFKLAQAFAARRGRPVAIDSLLRIASLGTIADLVPLVGENRVLASLGLRALGSTPSPGLRALFSRAGLRPPISASDVGFRIGPRLNAAGRLGSADDALELLLTRDAPRAAELAEKLEEANRRRQAEEAAVVGAATEMLQAKAADQRVLVAGSPDWHPGVVGIAAGRLAREFHRPTILFAMREGRATGSGRGIPGLDLHGFLVDWRTRYVRFGGHSQAVGLTVEAADLPGLETEWVAAARRWPAEPFARRLEYELALRSGDITPGLMAMLERLAPHGSGNPVPVARVGPLRVRQARRFGTDHLEMEIESPASQDPSAAPPPRLVAWRAAGEKARFEDGWIEVLGQFEWDSFRRSHTLRVLAARPAGD